MTAVRYIQASRSPGASEVDAFTLLATRRDPIHPTMDGVHV